MANMNQRMRNKLLPLLIEKYGHICNKCKKIHPNEIFIDHIDNNNNNNDFNNLQPLCRSCNTKKNHWRTTEPTNREGPPEYEAGKRNYKKAKIYVMGLLDSPEEKGALLVRPLIDDIANFVDCSQQQARNYIRKMCSGRHGLMKTEERLNGEFYLIYKSDKELNEIMKLDLDQTNS